MDNNEKQDLKELVAQDKIHVINFLKAHNLKVKDSKVSMLFSDTVENPVYKNLWLLNFEPALVKVEFELLNLPVLQGILQGILKILINKIVNRDLPITSDIAYEFLQQTQDNYYEQIEIKNNKITLIGYINYCS